MILLIDTCGMQGGVALVGIEDNQASVVRETVIVGKTFAAELVPAISAILQQEGLQVHSLQAVAVVYGPGSFTGVRIGVSAAKGLVEAAALPLIAISRLELLTRMAGLPGRTIAVFDAGRGEFYAGIYEGSQCICEMVMTQAQLEAELSQTPASVIVCEPRTEAALAALAPAMLPPPLPRDAMAIAVERWQSSSFADASALDGNYLRRTDAEILLKLGLAQAAGTGKAGSLEPPAC